MNLSYFPAKKLPKNTDAQAGHGSSQGAQGRVDLRENNEPAKSGCCKWITYV